MNLARVFQIYLAVFEPNGSKMKFLDFNEYLTHRVFRTFLHEVKTAQSLKFTYIYIFFEKTFGPIEFIIELFDFEEISPRRIVLFFGTSLR